MKNVLVNSVLLITLAVVMVASLFFFQFYLEVAEMFVLAVQALIIG